MTARDNDPAEFGTLLPEAAEVVRVLIALNIAMDQQQRELLYGRVLRRSYARDTMVRIMVTEFAEGRLLTIAEYQRRLAEQASRNTVRADAMTLVELGIAVLETSGEQAPAVCLRPTRRAIGAYNVALGTLREKLEEALQILNRKDQVQILD